MTSPSVTILATGDTPIGELPATLMPALEQTLVMTFVSSALSVAIGLPIAVLLVVTAKDGLRPVPWLYGPAGWIVNVGRSLPFIILLIALIPVTRAVAGTAIGVEGALLPLTIGGAAYFARLGEAALREVPREALDISEAIGASLIQTARKVLLPEALPGLISATTVLVVGALAFSAMAGAVGAGGLGDLAISYGYQRFDDTIMLGTVVVLIVLVQIFQSCGDLLVRIAAARR